MKGEEKRRKERRGEEIFPPLALRRLPYLKSRCVARPTVQADGIHAVAPHHRLVEPCHQLFTHSQLSVARQHC